MSKALKNLMRSSLAFMFLVSAVCMPVFSQICPFPESVPDPDSVPFHGMRMQRDLGDFSIIMISTDRTASGQLQIDIFFSTVVDPRTVRANDIKLNDKPLPTDKVIKFNKAGNGMRIIVSEEKNADIKLEFLRATGFNGSKLRQRKFEGLTSDCRFRYMHSRNGSESSLYSTGTYGKGISE